MLTNTGRRRGTEIAQVYVGKLPTTAVETPGKNLAGWARATLDPGESERVTVTLDPQGALLLGRRNRRMGHTHRTRPHPGGCLGGQHPAPERHHRRLRSRHHEGASSPFLPGCWRRTVAQVLPAQGNPVREALQGFYLLWATTQHLDASRSMRRSACAWAARLASRRSCFAPGSGRLRRRPGTSTGTSISARTLTTESTSARELAAAWAGTRPRLGFRLGGCRTGPGGRLRAATSRHGGTGRHHMFGHRPNGHRTRPGGRLSEHRLLLHAGASQRRRGRRRPGHRQFG